MREGPARKQVPVSFRFDAEVIEAIDALEEDLKRGWPADGYTPGLRTLAVRRVILAAAAALRRKHAKRPDR